MTLSVTSVALSVAWLFFRRSNGFIRCFGCSFRRF
ncbi:hypothetical protein ACIQ8C_05845 [Lysinibacillus xylanilyticus]